MLEPVLAIFFAILFAVVFVVFISIGCASNPTRSIFANHCWHDEKHNSGLKTKKCCWCGHIKQLDHPCHGNQLRKGE